MAESDSGSHLEVPAGEPPAGGPDFEGLLLRAGFNFNVFLAAALGFARERGATPAEFIAWVAERLAPTWTGLRGHGADAVANVMLENLSSTGYPVLHVEFGGDLSTATLGSVPLGLDEQQWAQLLSPFSVTPADMHLLFRVFVPLAATAGTSLELAGVRDSLNITLRRQRPYGDSQQPADNGPGC